MLNNTPDIKVGIYSIRLGVANILNNYFFVSTLFKNIICFL